LIYQARINSAAKWEEVMHWFAKVSQVVSTCGNTSCDNLCYRVGFSNPKGGEITKELQKRFPFFSAKGGSASGGTNIFILLKNPNF